MSKFYVVWNPNRTEGFITRSAEDAEFVSTGEQLGFGVSTAGDAFRETYVSMQFDDDDDDDGPGSLELPIMELEIPDELLDGGAA